MRFSSSSFLMSVLASSLLIIILCLILLSKRMVLKLSPQCVLFSILLIIVRCFFPCEFFFTYTLKSNIMLPLFQSIGQHAFWQTNLTVWRLFIFVWVNVAVIKIIVFLIKQCILEKKLRTLPCSRRSVILQHLLAENNIRKEIRLIEIPNISTPVLTGIKETSILIPLGISDSDLSYILYHEIEHYKNKDLYIIMILYLISIIYWWNPFIYILNNYAKKALECRVDGCVIENIGRENSIQYLQSILNIAKLRQDEGSRTKMGVFFYEKQTLLEQRFTLILNKKVKNYDHYLLCFMFTLFMISTAFIFEPYTIGEEYAKDTFNLPGKSFLLINGDKYDLYIDDEYYLTIDNADGFENILICEVIE